MSKLNRRFKKAQKMQLKNMMLQGHGASGSGDKGAYQHAAVTTSNPYYSNNFLYRWQEYVRWYMTSWEARKIIDIPVDDALRLPFEIKGVDAAIARDLHQAYEHFNLTRQNRRALIQERLLGGCCIVPVVKSEDGDDPTEPFRFSEIRQGDLEAFNVVDVSRITRVDYDYNPFSADYDRIDFYSINSHKIHSSRLIILDGNPLINRAATNILQNFRFNPAGFSESKLAPVYDSLVRMVGAQQAAYHLINMSSVLLIKYGHLLDVESSNSVALDKIRDVFNAISIYRGAVLDNPNAEVQQYSTNFGSVPELLMMLAQMVCAGTDIPATRFMSQSPAGMNATGESDAQNYFNMIGAYQNTTIKPLLLREFDYIGPDLMGYDRWTECSREIDIEFQPLWNESARVKAETARTYADMLRTLYEAGVINRDKVVAELIKRKAFETSEQVSDFLDEERKMINPFEVSDPANAMSELEKLAGQIDGGVSQ